MNELTREQILVMDSQQLAEATAVHVMKWKKVKPSNLRHDFEGFWQSGDGYWQYDCDDSNNDLWNPAEDITQAWEVEAHFNQDSEIRSDYMIKLYLIVGLQPHLKPSLDDLYLIAHATSEQRCKAALLAVMGL